MSKADLKQALTGPKTRPNRHLTRYQMLGSLAFGAAVLAALLLGSMLIWIALVDDPQLGHDELAADTKEPASIVTGSVPVGPSGPVSGRPSQPEILTFDNQDHLGRAISRADLVELSRFGPLPTIAADGLRPLDAYAQPLRPNGAKSDRRIALIVGNLGASQTLTQRAVKDLPSGVTLAFRSTGNSLDRWIRSARSKGHEILLQVPPDLSYGSGPEPGILSSKAQSEPNTAIAGLRWNLGRATSYVGVMAEPGQALVKDQSALFDVLAELQQRGLLLVDTSQTSADKTRQIAEVLDLPRLGLDRQFDHAYSNSPLSSDLDALEILAGQRGYAIGYVEVSPTNLAVLADWAHDLAGRGLTLVPISSARGHRPEKE